MLKNYIVLIHKLRLILIYKWSKETIYRDLKSDSVGKGILLY
ncbi:hypothetical protein DSM03_1212 [Leeuwenhoekiella aestuarii]|nr:hypothetical protein DSM03_1212 [Leeuwenhoekiella aestuarii]